MKILKCGFISIFFFNCFISCSFANKNNISFIDLDIILKQSNLGIKILENLNTINTSNLNKLKKRQEQLIKEEDELKKKQNVISQDELNIKIEELKKKFKQYNIEKENLSDSFAKKKDQEILLFFQKINPIIQEYMDNSGIKLLIEKKNIFIGRSTDDITQNILELINTKFK